MKYLLYLAFLISLNRVFGQDEPISSGIELSTFQISTESGSEINFGDSPEIILSKLGQPDHAEEYYFEMNDTFGHKYVYNSDEFYIMFDKLYTFILNTSNFAVGSNGNFLSVGDDISKVASIYTDYNALLKEGYLAIPFSFGGEIWDSVLVIEFDSVTGQIFKIMRYDP